VEHSRRFFETRVGPFSDLNVSSRPAGSQTLDRCGGSGDAREAFVIRKQRWRKEAERRGPLKLCVPRSSQHSAVPLSLSQFHKDQIRIAPPSNTQHQYGTLVQRRHNTPTSNYQMQGTHQAPLRLPIERRSLCGVIRAFRDIQDLRGAFVSLLPLRDDDTRKELRQDSWDW
jgi:hypothetical protein